MYYQTDYCSPLGKMSLVADETHLCGLWFYGQKYFEKGFEGCYEVAETPLLHQVIVALNAYFTKSQKDPFGDIAIRPSGTAFQKRVWQLLRTLPQGEVTTYGALAQMLGNASAQAVGNAIGHNPIMLIQPCHRVLASDGSLRGYSAGLEKKLGLLRHEDIPLDD